MPAYAYRATTAAGRTVRGREEAGSEAVLAQALSRRGLYPLEVRAVGRDAARGRPLRPRAFVSRRTDVGDFITTFAALLQAGLSLDRALEVAARGVARPDVSDAVAAARKRVREGGRLADGLAEYPGLFPPVAVGLIRAAESGGQLAEAVGRLGAYLEREKALRSRITSALVYPMLIVSAGGAAMLVLVLYVLPRFVSLLQESGSQLPRSTAILIAVSGTLTRGLPLLGLAGAVLIALSLFWRRTPAGRQRLHRLLLRVPLVGAIRARHATARLGYTLSTLLSGGVPLLQALDIAQGTLGDAAVGEEVRAARDAVRRGESFSGSLARGSAFSYAFVRLTEVGEETGTLDAVLERAARMLEAELERRLERMVALVEPTLIVVFGGVVGFVALALFQAIYGIQASGL